MEAVMRSAMVGVLFTQAPQGGYSYAVYLDGNRNGVLTRDVQRGVDPLHRVHRATVGPVPRHRVRRRFRAAPVDPGGTAPGADPIRLGSGSVASFSALGSATSGTLYIRSRRGARYAVRVYGETGKTGVLKFDSRTRRWKQI